MVDAKARELAVPPASTLTTAAEKLRLSPALFELLQRPTREMCVTIPLRRDDGTLNVFQGCRVQYGHAVGPCKGGVRFWPGEPIEQIRLLAFYMNLKCALLGLPFGGGKGSVDCDPRLLSAHELAQIAREYVVAISEIIGPDRDVMAPDIGTNEQTMAWMMDAYTRHIGHSAVAVVTGKPVALGGSVGRREATGRGVGLVTMKTLERLKMDARKTRVAIQGFGNIGSEAAIFLSAQGLKVVAVSDTRSGIHNPKGLSIHKLRELSQRNVMLEKTQVGDQLSLKGILEVDCDVLIPASVENQLTAENAPRVQAKIIVEGANGPTTPGADAFFEGAGVVVIPDILANAGGVTVSYFEWLQNKAGVTWSEDTVFHNLETTMAGATSAVERVSETHRVTRRTAATMIALERMAAVAALRLA